MKFDELTRDEQVLFVKLIRNGISDEIFLLSGDNYYSLLKKGLIRIIPGADTLSASVFLTEKGKRMRGQILRDNLKVLL